MLRDNIKRFEAKGCVVLGVSMDPPESHKKFCTEQKLPFDLLADTNKSVHKAFGFEKMVRATPSCQSGVKSALRAVERNSRARVVYFRE